MPLQKLQEFLDSKGVRYVVIGHSPAYTAQEVAASAHIAGRKLAKTVIIRIDGKMAMAVVPATEKVTPHQLQEALGAASVELVPEAEFKTHFPGCEPGAMPPFGNLFSMPVFVSPDLRSDDIAFNAGNHREIILMNYVDFDRLVQPAVFREVAASQKA